MRTSNSGHTFHGINPFILVISPRQSLLLENISMGNLHHNQSHNSPSNTFGIQALFVSYYQKPHRSRQYSLRWNYQDGHTTLATSFHHTANNFPFDVFFKPMFYHNTLLNHGMHMVWHHSIQAK